MHHLLCQGSVHHICADLLTGCSQHFSWHNGCLCFIRSPVSRPVTSAGPAWPLKSSLCCLCMICGPPCMGSGCFVDLACRLSLMVLVVVKLCLVMQDGARRSAGHQDVLLPQPEPCIQLRWHWLCREGCKSASGQSRR